MLTRREIGRGKYGNSLCSFYNFSLNLKLFQNKMFLKREHAKRGCYLNFHSAPVPYVSSRSMTVPGHGANNNQS